MPILTNLQKIILFGIVECLQAGVPMSDLAGTLMGNALILIAGGGLLWFVFTFRNPIQAVVEGNAVSQPVINYTSKAFIIVPSILLTVMALLWSFLGGLPALIKSSPELGLYFNGQPLEGQRIPVKMDKTGDSPPNYHLVMSDLEVREKGKKIGAQVNTPRLRLSEKDIECLSGCGAKEQTDDIQYPTVFRGYPFFINAGDKTFFQQILFRKRGHPSPEIKAQLELLYGPSDPIKATFTMLPYE